MNTADMHHEALRIAGEKVGADDRGADRRIAVHNPYTGQVVGSVPKATLAEADRAYAAAHAHKARLSRFERSNILNRAAALVRERTAEIAALITA
ncbi:MAG: aldehyde dehydrogenase family protein, partial [Rubrivivax sp.]|nr:aldehyde dehydrogenase family protein [Rubrivivax sp.]